ncbi:preprotein translocase subunit SecD [Halobacteriaceae bacterium SHR40]|uniref:preprotein translocase subunit SecD n=1 Tax=Halovenus amylolytica TaxID=2500550 RepID=UPI000FE361AD
MIDVRDNWRILMLVVLCLVAALALFGPLGAGDGETGLADNQTISDPTNLEYGLQLSGGARIRGSLVGQTAEGIEFTTGDTGSIERTVADELGVDAIDVTARAGDGQTGTIELFASSDNVSQAEFASALSSAGLDASADDIRDGVTDATRDRATDILQSRVDQTGLSGASVTTVSAATGGSFIIVEAPGEDRESLRELIGSAGRVQVIASYPDPNNDTAPQMDPILNQEDFASIQGATQTDDGGSVGVTLTEEAAEPFAEKMIDAGFTREGVGNCNYDAETDDDPSPNQHCLLTVVDGEIVYGASMGNLADTIDPGQSGDYSGFVADPGFRLNTNSYEEAQRLSINLEAGSLPTRLEIESSEFLSPSYAQAFKPLALVTGLLAWLAVSAVVYFWYRDVRVAIPMLVTATSEVFLLLGFAAAVGLALDLSHIAGLIAVIGTGLDDLIIMADEILQRKEEVKTGRVFQSRFRKAFWVIGIAAATTIIAMSPLAVLSLGDLQGFAIITIVGVIIGVAVTRPAYGDVLRKLMLDDVKRK